MKIKKQARRQAKQLFRLCVVNGLFNENRALQVVERVIQAKPRHYLAALTYFRRLVKLDYRQRAAKVEIATPLSPGWLAGVPARLERAYGPGLNVSVAENPALLGGMRIKVGSDVYDGSVEGRLAALEQNF